MNQQNNGLITPLMRQYFDIKKNHTDTLLLFQVGDFYELFFDDAKTVAACVGIALTKRGTHNGDPIPLCGVPVHALDYYLTKLIRAGHKVAICQQLEEARPGKVVDRGVTQVLTPGTLTDTKLLDEKSASYLFSLVPGNDRWGLLFGELLTAQLYATTLSSSSEKSLESELTRFLPDEIIIPHSKNADHAASLCKKMGYFVTRVDPDEHMRLPHEEWVKKQFGNQIYQELVNQESLRLSLYYFYKYLHHTNQEALHQFKALHTYQATDYLILDRATQNNLELIANTHDGTRRHTLLETMDKAVTPMGSRMIKKWVMRPLIKKAAIEQRLDAVETLVRDIALQSSLTRTMKEVGDIERVVGRIALGRAPLHDYLMLIRVLSLIPVLQKELIGRANDSLLKGLVSYLGNYQALHQLLTTAINDDASKEWIIKQGFDQRLDEIRILVSCAQEKIIELEQEEQKVTGINSLKIRYNNVQGYYIEITKANMASVPARYVRLQTLAGRERFLTPELQKLQHEINQARADIESVEKAVFDQVKREIYMHVGPLRKMAHALAHLDALAGLASLSYDHGYVRPLFNERRDVIITQGRHPIIEGVMNHGFIPNDACLNDAESTWIITGPNMGGKSTYMRQVALICIMAQMGCFVPAQSADLSLLDRIFTRIGAGDQLAQGKSTFLVEMEETATICTQATQHSLVILDEIGRGTSTFDGLAIAQAVLEYLHTHVKARCLFATHYHELTLVAAECKGMASYYAASKKTAQGILFLYKIMRGVADGSFGVEVAKLAGLPESVIRRSKDILEHLSATENAHQFGKKELVEGTNSGSYTLQYQVDELTRKIKEQETFVAAFKNINFDTLSPRAAFDLVWKAKDYL